MAPKSRTMPTPSDTLPTDGDEFIYRAWVRRKGIRVYAKDFGLKAWKIRRRY